MSSAQKSITQRSVQKSSLREKSDRLDYRQVFKEILYFVSEQESIVESLRCILCEYQDFEPYSTFKRLDKQDRGLLDLFDIQLFLRENAYFISEVQIQRLIQHYDQDGDGQLSYIECIFPKSNSEIRAQATQRPLILKKSLNPQVEKTLARLIESEVRLFFSLAEKMFQFQQLFNKANASKLFLSIDIHRRGKITYDDLNDFFRRLAVGEENISQSQITNILQRISRSDDDWNIQFQDFEGFFFPILTPIQQQQYQVQKLTNDLNEEHQRKDEVDKKMRRNQLYDNGEKKGQIVKQMVNFYTKRNPEKNKRLELCYTSDHIGVLPENIIKFYRKPMKKCDHHPDQYEKHDLAIAQIHKHQEPYRQRLEKSKQMNNKTYHVFSNQYQQQARNITDKQHRKIYNKQVETFLLAMTDIIYYENMVQSDKINLALRKDFTLQDFFSYFDLGRKTFITRDDVYTFFENFIFDDSIEVDVDIFMRRYDRHNNGKISFSDFCDMIVPKEEQIVEVLKKKPTNGLGFQQLTQDTKDLIYSTLQREIEYIDQIKNVLQSLEEIPNYNFYRIFTILDSDDNGFITEEDLRKEFKELKKNSKNKISDKEIQFLISVIDYDEDGQLSYNDFIETFTFYNNQDDENEDNGPFNNV